MNESKDVSIVIPTYNEEESVTQVVEHIKLVMESHSINYEIIVVDDGSTDKTAELLMNLPVKLIQHPDNRGYGASLKTGIRNASNEIIVITDADGTYSPDEIPNILSHIDQFDMVVGARTGRNVKIPLIRKPAKWFLAKLANYLSETKIPDLNSGLRAFRKGLVMKFFNILPNGFSFTTTITLGMHSNDYSVKYIPINYDKRSGKSKIRPIKDTLNFILLIISTTMYFNPLKVFLPISFIFLTFGIGLLYYDIFIDRNLGDKTILVFSVAFLIGVLGLLADLIVKKMGRIKE